MGLLSFLHLKDGDAPAPAPVPEAAPASKAAAPAAPAHAILCRTEIVDERHRLCGYRFSPPASGKHPPMAEAQFFEALAADDIVEFAQRRLALIPIHLEGVVFQRHLPLIAPHTVFLIDRAQANLPVDQIAARVAGMRDAGCKVALRGVTLDPADAPLLALCHSVLLNLTQHTLAEFQQITRELRALYPELRLAVEGVESWDEQRMCLSLGCGYFMGHFLTTSDRIDPNAKVDQSRLTSIELLNLLRGDAELPAMIEVAKRDPGMTFQVLQWANAPSNGQTTKVTSLNQAFMVLGRNQLYRGLTVSMFRLGSANKERDESLLEVALTRARFMETVAPGLPQSKRDELFLVGLLSLFDVLMGAPMASILAKMHLADDIRDVLLNNEGPYGPYLMMVMLLERDKVERAIEVAANVGVTPEELGPTGAAAFQWAQESLKHLGA